MKPSYLVEEDRRRCPMLLRRSSPRRNRFGPPSCSRKQKWVSSGRYRKPTPSVARSRARVRPAATANARTERRAASARFGPVRAPDSPVRDAPAPDDRHERRRPRAYTPASARGKRASARPRRMPARIVHFGRLMLGLRDGRNLTRAVARGRRRSPAAEIRSDRPRTCGTGARGPGVTGASGFPARPRRAPHPGAQTCLQWMRSVCRVGYPGILGHPSRHE